MQLIYQGPFDAVEIPALNDLVAVNGETVEILDDIAAQLLDQGDNWRKARTRSKKEN